MKKRLCNLADLQEVAVWIAEEAADLSTPVDWRRQEDGPSRFERLIGSTAVRHPKCQLVADSIRVLRWRKGDRGLVFGRPTAGHQEQPAPLKSEDARGATILAVDRGSQHISIELPRAVHVANHQQVGEDNPFRGKFGLCHHSAPLSYRSEERRVGKECRDRGGPS